MSSSVTGPIINAFSPRSESFKLRILIFVTALKLLLVPAYRSTDFEASPTLLPQHFPPALCSCIESDA